MGGIFALFIIVYAMYLDAKTLRQQDPESYRIRMKYSPRMWGFLAFLLFIVTGPAYYSRRKSYIEFLQSKEEEPISEEAVVSPETPKQESNPHFYQIIETTEVVLQYYFWSFIFTLGYVVLMFTFPIFKTMLFQLAILSQLSNAIMIYLIYLAIKLRNAQGFWESIGVDKKEGCSFPVCVSSFVFGVILAMISFQFSSVFSQNASSPLRTAMRGGTLSSMFVFVVVAIFMAPLFEELIFRGYFYSVIEKVKGKVYAIVSISLVFALMHFYQLWGDWASFLAIVVISFFFTLMRAKTGSTIPGITTHLTYNASILLIIPVLTLYFASPSYLKFSYYSRFQDFAEKEAVLKKSIENHPEFSKAYNDLAWTYAEEDVHLEEALDLIETALKDEPDNPYYLDTKAEVLYKLEYYDDAIFIEQQLVEKYGNHSFYKEQLQKFQETKDAELEKEEEMEQNEERKLRERTNATTPRSPLDRV